MFKKETYNFRLFAVLSGYIQVSD